MKITTEFEDLTDFTAYNAAPGGGAVERITVPLHHAEIALPESDLDGIIITGDLQFYDRKAPPEEDRRLLGFVVAEEIAALCETGLLPPASRLGVILVGDLYAEPCLLKRGGSGNVEEIWEAFAARFRWVTGVAGNYDLFEGDAKFPNRFSKISNLHPLDFDSVTLDGLRIGGISGIIGNPRRIWRYTDEELLEKAPFIPIAGLDCLILHQGPVGNQKGMRGAGIINEILSQSKQAPKLVAFGHCYWPEPFCDEGSMQFLNSDARVFLLTREGVEISL